VLKIFIPTVKLHLNVIYRKIFLTPGASYYEYRFTRWK